MARALPQPAVDFLYRHRFNPAVRWARQRVAGALGDTRDGVLIARGPLAGHRFAFSDSVAMWIGGHEPAVARTLARELRPGQVAYDVGAHVGFTAMLMAKAVGPTGRVLAFEPDPDNFELLARNVEINGLSAYVEPRRLALGAEPGGGSLKRLPLSINTRVDAGGSGEVQISTLDAEVFERGVPFPALILVDVEGMEEAVFRGATRLLAEHAPAILLEEGPADLLRLLADLGYAGTDVDVDHVLLKKVPATSTRPTGGRGGRRA